MDINQQNESQTFQDYRTRIGHYNSLTDALADAVLRGNLVWRICDETDAPFNLAEIYRFAEKYDKENPITGTEFYRVSREGAIGISMGLEYRVKWLFVPMEPGLERDSIIRDMEDSLLEDSDFAEAAKKAAALAPSPSVSVQLTQPTVRYFMLGAGRQKLGPFAIDELLANGLTPTTQVWAQGMSRWMKASEVALLADALKKRQPMPAPASFPQPTVKYRMLGPGNQKLGPFTIDELLANGLTPATQVWAEGMPWWMRASEVALLADALAKRQPAPAPAPTPTPAPQPAVKYRMYVNNQQYGPFTIDELIRNGVTPTTLVWAEGMPGWAKAADVPQLSMIFRK